MEKFTRRSRRLVALLLAVLFLVPTSIVRGQTLLHTVDNPGHEGAGFGQVVASLGDVDGDGAPDFVVGAPNQMVGESAFQGQAFVISGGTVLYTLTSPTPQAFAAFGWSVAATGDVNGDGTPDVAVGALFQNVVVPRFGGPVMAGRVFVFSGADGSLLYTVDNPAIDDGAVTLEELEAASFGYTIGTVGDLNGDGVRELAVGAPTHDVGGRFGQGRVYVYSGATGTPLQVLDNPDPQNFAFFGGAFTGVSDLNGDGVDDIAVGAPFQDGEQGRVFVFSGANGVLLGAVDNPTPQAGANFGDALIMVGDVNGDGLADLAVGAPAQTSTNSLGQTFPRSGRVFVFDGVFGAALLTLDAPNLSDPVLDRNTSFGRMLAAVGDHDGDGVADLAVAARDRSVPDLPDTPINSGAGVGKVYIFSNLSSGQPGLTTLPDEGNPVVPTNSNSNFGYQIVMVENGGGAGERYLAVSAPGQNVNGVALGQVFVYAMPAAGDTTPPPPADTTPPTLIMPAHVVAEATSPAGAVVAYPSPTATDDQDPAPAVTCTPASGSSFPLGSSTVTCAASDRSGNGAAASFTVTVRDSTPPDTIIQLEMSVVDGNGRRLGPGDSTLSSKITIEFVGSDAVGVAGYQCSWNSKAYSTCTSPASRSSLSTGKHVFRVRAQDGAGHTDPSPAMFEWTILTKGQAAKELKRSVKELELARREKAKMTALLREIKERLTDRRRSNDKSVCGELDAFLKHLGARERARVLTSADTAPIRQLAESLRASIQCRVHKSWHAGHHGRR